MKRKKQVLQVYILVVAMITSMLLGTYAEPLVIENSPVTSHFLGSYEVVVNNGGVVQTIYLIDSNRIRLDEFQLVAKYEYKNNDLVLESGNEIPGISGNSSSITFNKLPEGTIYHIKGGNNDAGFIGDTSPASSSSLGYGISHITFWYLPPTEYEMEIFIYKELFSEDNSYDLSSYNAHLFDVYLTNDLKLTKFKNHFSVSQNIAGYDKLTYTNPSQIANPYTLSEFIPTNLPFEFVKFKVAYDFGKGLGVYEDLKGSEPTLNVLPSDSPIPVAVHVVVVNKYIPQDKTVTFEIRKQIINEEGTVIAEDSTLDFLVAVDKVPDESNNLTPVAIDPFVNTAGYNVSPTVPVTLSHSYTEGYFDLWEDYEVEEKDLPPNYTLVGYEIAYMVNGEETEFETLNGSFRFWDETEEPVEGVIIRVINRYIPDEPVQKSIIFEIRKAIIDAQGNVIQQDLTQSFLVSVDFEPIIIDDNEQGLVPLVADPFVNTIGYEVSPAVPVTRVYQYYENDFDLWANYVVEEISIPPNYSHVRYEIAYIEDGVQTAFVPFSGSFNFGYENEEPVEGVIIKVVNRYTPPTTPTSEPPVTTTTTQPPETTTTQPPTTTTQPPTTTTVASTELFDEEAVALGALDEPIELEIQIPLDALPQTNEGLPLMFYLFGSGMISLGLFFRRKKF